MAHGLAAHSGARLGLISENIANADTPKYQARDLQSFANLYAKQSTALRATRERHLNYSTETQIDLTTKDQRHLSPNKNSVSLEAEMVKAAEVRKDHEMALAIYSATSSIIRSSLGRK